MERRDGVIGKTRKRGGREGAPKPSYQYIYRVTSTVLLLGYITKYKRVERSES